VRAASYSSFGGPITVGSVPEPSADRVGAVVEVRATGICRSDWHGWQGHDPDIVRFPHVPGHEFAGVVAEVGPDVTQWSPGDRVAVPFVSGCGRCGYCTAGRPQICPDQTQPGFTHWGSFAERVVIRNADFNLVRLPDSVDFETGASLGCRFSTAHRAVVDQGGAQAGDWVAIHGCGGVGVSAVMIAAALGARPIGIDPRPEARALALDCVGAPRVVADAVASLRPGGCHVQVGLLPGPASFGEVVASRVVARELTIVGSHGIAPSGLAHVLELTANGDLRPDRLIGRRVDLHGGVEVLMHLDEEPALGITVVTEL
jgi:alcohol dehydrogenase